MFQNTSDEKSASLEERFIDTYFMPNNNMKPDPMEVLTGTCAAGRKSGRPLITLRAVRLVFEDLGNMLVSRWNHKTQGCGKRKKEY